MQSESHHLISIFFSMTSSCLELAGLWSVSICPVPSLTHYRTTLVAVFSSSRDLHFATVHDVLLWRICSLLCLHCSSLVFVRRLPVLISWQCTQCDASKKKNIDETMTDSGHPFTIWIIAGNESAKKFASGSRVCKHSLVNFWHSGHWLGHLAK